MKEQVAEIVAAYVRKNLVAATELPSLINQVNQTLSSLGQPLAAPAMLSPAVPIKRSVQPEAITCLDCGHRQRILKRHLMTAHQLTPAAYRERWGLKADYPLVAPSYAARRSELAKAAGLGKKTEPKVASRPSRAKWA